MSRGNRSVDLDNPKVQYILYVKVSSNDRVWGVYDTLPALRAAIGKTDTYHKYYVKKAIINTNTVLLSQEEVDYIEKTAIDKNRDVKCLETDIETIYDGELWNADPNCKHVLDPHCWSGIRCKKCGGSFCY